ncbi:MAG: tRNA (N(6)-L-threonylcarbamoyladenosine(37)-C(2))-methylthiotransferase MtaB [Caldisericaceae bacterium]|nr:tRNA (N(6)-L-threonylcarbamoyladenosine(37)-C(2))-methylthiotransferase MtaB [Caldisericaceae bacterium]
MRVAIYTLGCKTNQYETELIRESFESHGDIVVSFHNNADLYIINSCVVTSKAEAETRKAVHRAKRTNSNAKIIITSCFAKLHPDFKENNIFLYTGERRKIADFYYNNTYSPVSLQEESIKKFSGHTRATIKIEEGCNNFCAYCIVPFVRGSKIKSKTRETISKEVQELSKAGYKEIVLSGTEIGKYGEDIRTSLASLLKTLKTIKRIERIRISSIHPTAITDDLIRELSPLVTPHLHISLQSGNNEVLKKMNRNYTTEEYLSIVERLRKKDPNFSITTDIIVGFPGETDNAFLNSVSIVGKAHFSKVHIFRYSKRPFTPAYFMKETVSESLKKTRAERLLYAVNIERVAFKNRFLNKTVKVLVEEKDGVYYIGFTPYYLKTKFTGSNIKLGEIIPVTVKEIDANYLYGRSI